MGQRLSPIIIQPVLDHGKVAVAYDAERRVKEDPLPRCEDQVFRSLTISGPADI